MLQLHYDGAKGCSADHFPTTGPEATGVQDRLQKRMIALYRRRINAILLDERREKVGEVIADGSVEGTWWYDSDAFPAITPAEHTTRNAHYTI